jgi:hypothetical protein
MFAQQVVDEFFARIVGQAVGRVHQAHGRRGDDGLLDGQCGIPHGNIDEVVGVAFVAERAGGQAWHAACMTRCERNREPIRPSVAQAVYAVGPEIVVLALFPIGDDR